MGAYTYPGVYIEEISSGQHTITGVATSIAAFVGWTNQGPVGTATMVESWAEYQMLFGGLIPGNPLGYAVYQFFGNGGAQAYIVRLVDPTAATASSVIGGLQLYASNPGAWANGISVQIYNVKPSTGSTDLTFNLKVVNSATGQVLESYTNLSVLSTSPNYAVTTINNDSNYVSFTPQGGSPPAGLPMYTVAGSVTFGTFVAGEMVTQGGSGATANVVGLVSGSGPLTLGAISVIANASGIWTGGTSGATFKPGAVPVFYISPTQISAGTNSVAGSVTPPTSFAAGDTVKQTTSGATASVVGSVPTTGPMVLGTITGTPNAIDKWTASPSGAVFTPTAAPMVVMTPVSIALNGGTTPSSSGADGPVLTPNTSGFHTALIGPNGYQLLANVSIFNILCVPEENDAGQVPAMMDFCSTYRAFMIVDSGSNATSKTLQAGPTDWNGQPYTFKNPSYGAFYYPWISAQDPQAGFRPALFPPCGYVAGAFAATDANRGVWKAPAGIGANLSGALGLQTVLNDADNGQLNPVAVNCLRHFRTYGNVIWGARTLDGADAAGSQWKYVPIRRLAMYIESSLYEGTQWVVFEPNAEPLWGQVRLSIGTFLQELFLKGAFAGTTPKQAYFVKCDSDNNPDFSIAQGIVNITVGFAPLYPAEFVVIQITQIANS